MKHSFATALGLLLVSLFGTSAALADCSLVTVYEGLGISRRNSHEVERYLESQGYHLTTGKARFSFHVRADKTGRYFARNRALFIEKTDSTTEGRESEPGPSLRTIVRQRDVEDVVSSFIHLNFEPCRD